MSGILEHMSVLTHPVSVSGQALGTLHAPPIPHRTLINIILIHPISESGLALGKLYVTTQNLTKIKIVPLFVNQNTKYILYQTFHETFVDIYSL